jgi:hypothetical protein
VRRKYCVEKRVLKTQVAFFYESNCSLCQTIGTFFTTGDNKSIAGDEALSRRSGAFLKQEFLGTIEKNLFLPLQKIVIVD